MMPTKKKNRIISALNYNLSLPNIYIFYSHQPTDILKNQITSAHLLSNDFLSAVQIQISEWQSPLRKSGCYP